MERFLARHTDVLVAVSPEIRDELVELGIGSNHNYVIVPLGLDLSEYFAVSPLDSRGRPHARPGPPTQDGSTTSPHGAGLRHRFKIPDDEVLIAMIGRLVPIKNHMSAIAAVAEIPSAHLVIVGDGESRDAIMRTVEEMRMVPRVHFTGWSLHVHDLFDDIDLVVLTSRNEGTPVSLIEASAAARPSVATDVGGVRHVVRDGLTGFVVPRDSPGDLVRALERLVDNPHLRHKQGVAAREYVAARFSSDRLLSDVRSLYEDLLDSHRAMPLSRPSSPSDGYA